jgi:flagellar biosynthesis GTPase FlhF
MAHTVFICHSSKDKLVADAACAALEAQRIPCWIAPRDILAGDEWGESIIDALSGCQIVLLIFSLNANNSPQVRREIERAVSKEKIIVPFRIEDVLPSRAMEFALSNTHWMDAISPPMEHRLTELCATISRLMQRQTGAGPMWQVQSAAEEVERKAREAEEARLKEAEAARQAEALRLREEAELQRQLQEREQQARKQAERKAREAEASHLKEEERKAQQAAEAKAKPEPAPEQARAQTVPQSVPEPKGGSRGFPRWAWGVLATVALIAVFAAGRLFSPMPAPTPTPVPQPQAAASQAPPTAAPVSPMGAGAVLVPNSAPIPTPTQQSPAASGTWTDPATGLMWMKQDNGSNVTWQQAMDYCQRLQLAGHSDWRLTTIDELQGIYDASVNIPGHCCGSWSVTWHVKGNLQLSGWDWSSSQGDASLGAWVFNFDNGVRGSQRLWGNYYGRALCVRRSGG